MQCLALCTILCSAFLIKSFHVMLRFPILLKHSKWLFSIKKLLHSILPNSKELPKSRKIQEEKVDFSRGTKFLGGSCFAFGYIKKDFESLLFENRLRAYFTWHIYIVNLAIYSIMVPLSLDSFTCHMLISNRIAKCCFMSKLEIWAFKILW